ncbi:DNA-binding MarR family transcriptional regulator [Primorskyibacter sedentarius]|uniref:DNA-binding MarR family transcriptional regulator n=1 Tax=Primorskyibacter sedentarius TaxID=745311 RepID=A0A4R3J5G1_9RHOB|nr:MarR family transcriptional regulator [Primorskyibacter sedentarius]TCS61129.1 DNA-binding MarR family transcriptional regulator [Primorskyibacter sedentarius]
MSKSTTNDFARIIVNAFSLQSAITSNQMLADKGLTTAGWLVLRRLSNKEDLSVAALGRAFSLTRQRMFQIVNRLAEKGYVELQINEEEKRARKVLLTAEGREVLKAVEKELTALLGDALSEMPEKSMDKSARMLRKLTLAISGETAEKADA